LKWPRGHGVAFFQDGVGEHGVKMPGAGGGGHPLRRFWVEGDGRGGPRVG
jgi:hypothetical protein